MSYDPARHHRKSIRLKGHADALFTPHVTPGGMLDRLLKERAKV